MHWGTRLCNLMKRDDDEMTTENGNGTITVATLAGAIASGTCALHGDGPMCRMNVVDRMARLVMIAHNGVNRDGPGNVPYIVHPHAVVSMLKKWGYTETDDPVTLAVAWGHDVLEDTDMPESTIRGVDDVLGERILAGIKMLTFKPGISSGHPDYGRLKADYISNVARTAPPEVIVVKIADRLCNTLDFMNDGNEEHAYAYLGYGEPLFRRIGDCKHSKVILEVWDSVKECVSGREQRKDG